MFSVCPLIGFLGVHYKPPGHIVGPNRWHQSIKELIERPSRAGTYRFRGLGREMIYTSDWRSYGVWRS